jgi:hypothetical protein
MKTIEFQDVTFYEVIMATPNGAKSEHVSDTEEDARERVNFWLKEGYTFVSLKEIVRKQLI